MDVQVSSNYRHYLDDSFTTINLLVNWRRSVSSFVPGRSAAPQSESQGHYQTGQWESNGHIYIPKTIQSPKGYIYKPQFCITFHELNKPLVLKLQSLFGGSIRHRSHAQDLRINSIKGLCNIVTILNGKQRTPKDFQFKGQINWLNARGHKFTYLGLASDSLLSNPWFAGFMDADGSFDIQIVRSWGRVNPKVRVRFRQIQRKEINLISYYAIMNQIKEEFKLNQDIVTNRCERELIVLTSNSQLKLIILNLYFKSFSQFTFKRFDYLDWSTAYEYMRKGQHLTKEGLSKVYNLRARMNTRRPKDKVNWDFLKTISYPENLTEQNHKIKKY